MSSRSGLESTWRVLIPTLIPSRLRYRFLHNQLDLVLSAELRTHPEVIVARVTMPLEDEPGGDASSADSHRLAGRGDGAGQ